MASFNKNQFAERLIQLRKERRMSQVELSRASGIPQGNISSYENALVEPSASSIARLAQALFVSADVLLDLKPMKPPTPELEPGTRVLWKRFKRINQLSQRDQRAFLRLLHSFARTRALLKARSQNMSTASSTPTVI